MKLSKLMFGLMAACFVVNAAPARPIGPGEWALDTGIGGQYICLLSNGTWYSPSYANWGGVWKAQNVARLETATLVGNFDSGAGNTSIVIRKKIMTWNSWTDDLSNVDLMSGKWNFRKATCDGPAKGPNKHKTPMEGQ